MLKATLKGTAFAAALLALPSLAAAAPVKLTVTNGLAPAHVVSTKGIEPWMACVTEETKGEVTFDYFPGGQISTVRDTTDALAAGLADIGFMSPANEGSKLPLNGIAMLPGGGNSATEITEAYRGAFSKGGALAAEFKSLGLRPFIFNSLAPYQVMTRNKVLDSYDAFSGVKIRSSGGAMTFAAMSMKAVPTEMPAGDLYIALERGTVDGTILAMSSVKTYSLQELVTSMSGNGSFGTSTQFFAISEASWGKLDAAQQGVVESCGSKVEASLAAYLDEEQIGLRKEFEAAGIKVFDFSDAELTKINAALDTASDDYLARLTARGLPAQEVFDSLRAPATN